MRMGDRIGFYTRSFFNVFYPNYCNLCDASLNSQENHVCLNCLYDLPYLNGNNLNMDKLNRLFWGRVQVEHVYSLLDYQKGNQSQQVLHQLKYKKKRKLGYFFGRILANELMQNERFDKIVPVPLHPKKLKERGFNQSSVIAKGISDGLNVPVDENIMDRIVYNPSQTKFSKYDRWNNVRKIFELKTPKSTLEGLHILLVDDVMTTGATLEACVQEFNRIENCTVSIATLAARI